MKEQNWIFLYDRVQSNSMTPEFEEEEKVRKNDSLPHEKMTTNAVTMKMPNYGKRGLNPPMSGD